MKLLNWTELPEGTRNLLADIEPDYFELEAIIECAQFLDQEAMDVISDMFWGKTGKFLSATQKKVIQDMLIA